MANLNGNMVSDNQINGSVNASQSMRAQLDARREIVMPANFEDLADVEVNNVQNGQVPKYNAETGKWENKDDAAGDEAVWGNIHGTMSDQTDLQSSLDSKLPVIANDYLGAKNILNPIGYGKSLSYGVTSSTVYPDGSVKLTMLGQYSLLQHTGGSSDDEYDMMMLELLKGKTIRISGGEDSFTYIQWIDNAGGSARAEARGTTIEVSDEITTFWLLIVANCTDKMFYPMLSIYDDTDDTWRPFSYTNVQLTEKVEEVKELIENWSNVKRTRVMCASPNIGHYGIGEWQSVLDSPTAQQEAAWGWWQDDAFKLLGGTPGYDVDFDFGYDPSGDVVTLGGYIVDTDTGYLCLKFANYVANPANVRVFVDITIMQNNAPTT